MSEPEEPSDEELDRTLLPTMQIARTLNAMKQEQRIKVLKAVAALFGITFEKTFKL
jgi:hypothetical protein